VPDVSTNDGEKTVRRRKRAEEKSEGRESSWLAPTRAHDWGLLRGSVLVVVLIELWQSSWLESGRRWSCRKARKLHDATSNGKGQQGVVYLPCLWRRRTSSIRVRINVSVGLVLVNEMCY
jgi:hypothetical protein